MTTPITIYGRVPGMPARLEQPQSILHAMAARGLYVHLLPGRLRVEAPALRNSQEVAAAVTASIQTLPGVSLVQVSPLTGRVLVEYSPAQLDYACILQELDRLGCLESPRHPQRPMSAMAPPAPSVNADQFQALPSVNADQFQAVPSESPERLSPALRLPVPYLPASASPARAAAAHVVLSVVTETALRAAISGLLAAL